MCTCSRVGDSLALALELALTFVLVATTGAACARASGSERPIDQFISQGLRHNAEGNYDAACEVWNRMREFHPDHPAANVYAADTLYWRMIHQDSDTRYDVAIQHECEEAIRKAESWVDATPDDAYAHFYLGQALIHLGRLYGVRGRLIDAGVLGERAREELERSLELNPNLIDAKFPLGLYYYYASLVPSLFKWLGFLWFVPTGDGETGIVFMDDVARSGDLHRVTAEFTLAGVRSYHPERIDHDWALEKIRGLHERYPENAIVHFELLKLLEMHGKHRDLVLEARALETHPGTGREQRGRAAVARVWRARGEMMLHRIDEAWETLAVFGEDGPENPDWGARWVQLTRAQLLDLRGEREAALDLYRVVLASDSDASLSPAQSIALIGIERPFELSGSSRASPSRPAGPGPREIPAG